MKSVKFLVFFLILSIPSALLISCSQGHSSEIVYLNEDTLRSLTEEKERNLVWTRELESVRLLRDISKNKAVDENSKLSTVMLCAVHGDYLPDPIYPELPGFGSLDTSSLSKEHRAFFDEFSEQISMWKFPEERVEKNSLFFLALFKSDVENGWKDFFGTDFPLEEKNESQKTDKKEARLFTSWLYGKPFVDEDSILVPVRFFCAEGSVDVRLCSSKEKPIIDQIAVIKWNGK